MAITLYTIACLALANAGRLALWNATKVATQRIIKAASKVRRVQFVA